MPLIDWKRQRRGTGTGTSTISAYWIPQQQHGAAVPAGTVLLGRQRQRAVRVAAHGSSPPGATQQHLSAAVGQGSSGLRRGDGGWHGADAPSAAAASSDRGRDLWGGGGVQYAQRPASGGGVRGRGRLGRGGRGRGRTRGRYRPDAQAQQMPPSGDDDVPTVLEVSVGASTVASAGATCCDALLSSPFCAVSFTHPAGCRRRCALFLDAAAGGAEAAARGRARVPVGVLQQPEGPAAHPHAGKQAPGLSKCSGCWT